MSKSEKSNVIKGTRADDVLVGTAGNDKISGGRGNDSIDGGDGDDLLGPGFGGTDWLYGGAGNDTATFLVAVQAVTADLVAGTATRGAAVANLFSIENLTGSTLDDVLRGNGLDNRLKGEDGNDILVGRGGNDLLIGGAGNDKFIFASGSGQDTITDFTAGAGSEDVIDIAAYGFAELASLMANTTDVGANTVIDFNGIDTLTLLNVQKADLHADDFLF